MTNYQKIEEILNINNGYITSKDIRLNKIPPSLFTKYKRDNDLVKIYRGFYSKKDWLIDDYLVFQYIYPNLIFSLRSALFIHKLITLDKLSSILYGLEVTSIKGSTISSFKFFKEVTFHVIQSKEEYELGIMEVNSPFNNKIKVYDKEKTICDLVKFKSQIELTLYLEVLFRYFNSKDKDITKLINYSKVMNIEDKVKRVIDSFNLN